MLLWLLLLLARRRGALLARRGDCHAETAAVRGGGGHHTERIRLSSVLLLRLTATTDAAATTATTTEGGTGGSRDVQFREGAEQALEGFRSGPVQQGGTVGGVWKLPGKYGGRRAPSTRATGASAPASSALRGRLHVDLGRWGAEKGDDGRARDAAGKRCTEGGDAAECDGRVSETTKHTTSGLRSEGREPSVPTFKHLTKVPTFFLEPRWCSTVTFSHISRYGLGGPASVAYGALGGTLNSSPTWFPVIFGKEGGPQRDFQRGVGLVQGGNRTIRHGKRLGQAGRGSKPIARPK